MKKIILSAIVAVCAISANAQVWAGGKLGFNATSGDAYAETETQLTIAPEIGYTINDNWDVAAAINFSLLNNRAGIKDANVTEFTVEPYARYTFAEAGIAKFFVDGYVGFGSYKPKGVDATTTFKVGVRPGVKVALSDDICLVSTLGNLGYKTVKDSYNQFGFNLDNAINFGIYFNF
jgi:hypothetical protein